ncbi:MAG: autotransporter-associated beta strand repeat-containing protein [Verrucomicrobiota bacterium]
MDSNGTWSLASNWSSTTIADGSGFTANFTNNITADRTIDLDSSRTLTSLIFGDATPATAGSWTLSSASSSVLTLAGTTPTITVNALGTSKTATISTTVAGTAGLTKDGIGTLILTGANTYSGVTAITAGNLQVGNASTTGTLGTGAVSVASGAKLIFNRSNAHTLPAGNVISGAGVVQHNGAGTLSINHANTYSGGTTLSSAGNLSISNGSALGTGTVTLAKAGTNAAGILQLTGGITLANTMHYSSVNAFSNGGTAQVENISGNNTLSGLQMMTSAGGNGLFYQSDAGILTIDGNLSSAVAGVSTPRFHTFAGAGDGVVNGVIENDATLEMGWEKVGAGKWTFNGANTNTFPVSVQNGTVLAGNNSAFGNDTIRLGSTLSSVISATGGRVLTNGTFTIANPVDVAANPASGSNVLGGNTDNTSTFSGAINLSGDLDISQAATTGTHALNITGGISSVAAGARNVEFTGPGRSTVSTVGISNGSAGTVSVTVSNGTTDLDANSAYTGATAVTGGTLYVNGLVTGTSGVTVSSGTTLGGSGNISSASAVTTISGIIAPGPSPSTISTLGTRAISFENGSTYDYNLNTTSLGGDLINSNGPFSLDGTVVLAFNDLAPGTLPMGSRLTLLSYSGIWDGDIFSGRPNGSNFVLGGNNWQINYADPVPGANGGAYANNVTLTTVPEPVPSFLGALALTALLSRRHRVSGVR